MEMIKYSWDVFSRVIKLTYSRDDEVFLSKKHQITKNENLMTHANITKAKNLLGYNPKVSIDDGILRFLDWHKQYENF